MSLLGPEFVEAIVHEEGKLPRKIFIDTTNIVTQAGAQGPKGDTGPAGANGQDGQDGVDGLDGGLSYYKVIAGTTLNIPVNRQHLVKGPFINEGTLIVIGQQVVI